MVEARKMGGRCPAGMGLAFSGRRFPLEDLKEFSGGDDWNSCVLSQGQEVFVARDDILGMAFYGAGEHIVIGGVGRNDLNFKGPRRHFRVLDEQPQECLFLLGRKADQGSELGIGENPMDLPKQVGGAHQNKPSVPPGCQDPVLEAAGPDGHADNLICIQDDANHRRARAARTASSSAASSFFTGIFLALALIRSRILNRSFRFC